MLCTRPQKPQNDVCSFLRPNFTIAILRGSPLTRALKRARLVDSENITNNIPRYLGNGARYDVS